MLTCLKGKKYHAMNNVRLFGRHWTLSGQKKWRSLLLACDEDVRQLLICIVDIPSINMQMAQIEGFFKYLYLF